MHANAVTDISHVKAAALVVLSALVRFCQTSTPRDVYVSKGTRHKNVIKRKNTYVFVFFMFYYLTTFAEMPLLCVQHRKAPAAQYWLSKEIQVLLLI